MEIKIFCSCGTKYKFDVQPVNERMPWPVTCPACGLDGTADANEILKQGLPFDDQGPAITPPPLPKSPPRVPPE